MPIDKRILDAIKKAYFIKGLIWNDVLKEVIPVKYINNIIMLLEDIYYYQQTNAEK